MHNLDMQVLNTGLQRVPAHELWLCTVLSTSGSSPRPPGAMMIIRKEGHHCGSLSGGCVEESFIEHIDRNAFPAASQVVRYGEGGFEPDRALPCGGVLDILVEKLPPGAESRAYLQQMHDALVAATAVKKKIILPHPCYALEPAAYTSSTLTYRDGAAITLTLSTAPRLVIGGLSSVAVFCANFAVALGFETIVCEHRDEAFYIGAMGSKKNSLRRKERLGQYGDLAPDQISRIHAPVGLDIGSKTPSEIALSVMADIVRYKNGCVAAAQPRLAEVCGQGSLL